MSDVDGANCLIFADSVFSEVDVFGSLGGDGSGPCDGSGVVVVDGGGGGHVWERKVVRDVTKGEEVNDAFVCSVNLGLS